eukprot:9215410-Pyramimonas_sp.AAC.1
MVAGCNQRCFEVAPAWAAPGGAQRRAVRSTGPLDHFQDERRRKACDRRRVAIISRVHGGSGEMLPDVDS